MSMNQHDSKSVAVICQLLRKVVDPAYAVDIGIIESADWKGVMRLASRQGVLAVIFDALSGLPGEVRPDQKILLPWIKSVVGYEKQYARHSDAVSELSAFYESHGIRMMLLKGWGLSLNYPHPDHRPCGDVDIWLYGDQERGDALLAAELDIHPVKSSHHTIFFYKGAEVENHITFIETDCHEDDGSEELIMKFAEESPVKVVSARGNSICLPSHNLNAYFLLRHSSAHFATESITLRHLLDWAFFVNKYHSQINWDQLYANAEKVNMHIFMDCQNAICVNELGFPAEHFPVRASRPALEKRIFMDILFPEFKDEAPPMRRNFLKYCYVKTRRNFANRWKYDITYKESFLSILFRFAWNRIRSPYSFADIMNKNKK